MTSKRPRGRPRRGNLEAGRELILAATRKLLREAPRLDLVGTEIAHEAGLTPASVLYHFSSTSELLETASIPVFDSYLDRLTALVNSSASLEEKLYQIVMLFIEIAREDGFLIERTIRHLKNVSAGSTDRLSRASLELRVFFSECERAGYLRRSSIPITITLIWASCRFVSQMPELQQVLGGGSQDQIQFDMTLATAIVDIVTRGLVPRKSED